MVDFNAAQSPVDVFNTLTSQSQALPYGDGTRVPFGFTSVLRDLEAIVTGSGTSADVDANLAAVGFGQVSAEELTESVTRLGVGGLRVIETLINPTSISWRQPKRIRRKDVRTGTVFFHFADETGRDNDIVELELRGTTGNVNVRADGFIVPTTQDVAARRKLDVFQNLWLLTREPVVIPPNIVNQMTIEYRTKLVPTGVSLNGFFSEVLTFEESGDKPNSAEWTMSFTVESVFPNLDNILPLTRALTPLDTPPQPSRDSALFQGIGSAGLGGANG